jgi:hypothetical protein
MLAVMRLPVFLLEKQDLVLLLFCLYLEANNKHSEIFFDSSVKRLTLL